MSITSQNPQINPPGKVSETQRLTAESDRLSHAVDSWNSWYVGLGVAALIVAFLVFFAQWRIIRRSKELSSVQSDLIAAKDRQAAAGSKDQDERIAAAQNKAAESNEAAGKANERAGNAELAASRAQENLAAANERAAHAEKGAADASAKAEGFRAEIARSNEAAAQAQAQVAGAMAEAAKANLELERIKKPRTLDNSAALIESLKPYKGTEYTFSAVFGDEESIILLRQIDAALANSGWVRVKPPHAFPAINIYGTDQDFAVAQGMTSGIKVSVNSDIPLTKLQTMPVDILPAPTGAAVALAIALTGSVNPSQEAGIKANVELGNSSIVRIEVGRKP